MEDRWDELMIFDPAACGLEVEAPLLLLLVTHSGVGSTFGAHSCMAKSLKNLF